MAPLIKAWRGFSAGQRVEMLIATRGATATDEELTYPAGTCATILAAADFGKYQGMGVHVEIGDADRAICNSFDDRDVEEFGGLPFRCA